MPAHLISRGTLTPAQCGFIQRLLDAGPDVARVHLGVPFKSPSAFGVTFRKPGRKPQDPELAPLYRDAPKPGPWFIIAIRGDVTNDAQLLLTLAHELEHVRQELTCPGLLEFGNCARDYVADNASAFPTLPCELFVPVNLHAEARAARDVAAIIGQPAVDAHYADRPTLRGALDRTDSESAAQDLAAFLSAHCDHFKQWYLSVIRPTKPPLNSVQDFVLQHRQAAGRRMRG